MPRGNPSPKIAVTIDPHVYEMAVGAATRDGVSLSAYITEAVRRRLMIEQGLASILEWELDNGPFTQDEIAASNKRVDDEIARLQAKVRKKRSSA